jgi:outer membrane protein TolC
VASEYFRILADSEILANTKTYNESLKEMYAQLEKRAEAGLLPRHELEQANQDIIDSQAKLNKAQMEYRNRLDDFKLLLAVSPESEITLSSNELEAVRKALKNPVEMDMNQAVEMALWQRADLINSSDSITDAERKVHVAEDALRAELNIAGLAGGRNLDGKTASDNYRLSLELDLPIDRTTEKTRWQASLLALVQAQRDYAALEDLAAAEARKGVRDMELSRERYEIELRGCELARKRSNSTAMLLQYNRANTRDLLDAKEDFIDAQDNANDAMSNYISATLRLLADTGSLKLNTAGTPNLALSNSN